MGEYPPDKRDLTWGEFVAQVEAQGVTVETRIAWIDTSSTYNPIVDRYRDGSIMVMDGSRRETDDHE